MSADTSELRLYAKDLRVMPEKIVPQVSKAVRKTLHDIEGDAKRINKASAFDTGNLNNSISTEVDGDGLGGVVGPTADYGVFIEEGTEGPYPIPNAFGWGITVMHPGISPRPFMGPAFDRRSPSLDRALDRIIIASF